MRFSAKGKTSAKGVRDNSTRYQTTYNHVLNYISLGHRLDFSGDLRAKISRVFKGVFEFEGVFELARA